MEGESQDWEMLQSSGSAGEEHPRSMEEIDDVTQGVIRFDYFSLDNNDVCRKEADDEDSDNGSVGSASPSWIEPGSDPPYGKKHPCEFWSDSSSDRSEDRKLVDFGVNNDLGLEYSGINDSLVRDKHLRKYWLHSGDEKLNSVNSGITAEESDNHSGVSMGNEEQSTLSGELVSGNDPLELVKLREEKSCGFKSLVIDQYLKSGDDGPKKGLSWWKIPFELFKYCVFRVNPVWSFSMAAAVLGFVMLGRRLYKMKKKKSHILQLKVSLDDKKVSQLGSHSGRLNKAIPTAKRIPIIRPALPAMAVNQWPVVSLR